VDIGLSVAGFALDSSPGRHLAVLGTSPVGADVLEAIAIGLSHQHESGTATFYLASLIDATDDSTERLAEQLRTSGHVAEVVGLSGYQDCLRRLSDAAESARGEHVRGEHGRGQHGREQGTYLFAFGADAASSALKQRTPGGSRTGIDDFRALLRDGPGSGTHLFGWWRGTRRLSEDLGINAKEDISGILVLNVRGSDVGLLIGQSNLNWNPRHNRALLIDRQEDTADLVVPFVRTGRYAEEPV
jgi:hypothetical protein